MVQSEHESVPSDYQRPTYVLLGFSESTAADGFIGTCPVDALPANGYGLHNMTGNVWDWCADWYSSDFHIRDRRTNPQGPPRGANRSTRGGSYLCPPRTVAATG